MATLQTTFDLQPDTEGILSVKCKLKEREETESLLLSNLDFAEKLMRHNPLSEVSTLLVKGDVQYVRIVAGTRIIYTVSSEHDKKHVDCTVYCDDFVDTNNVELIHFSMHSCQDEVMPCFSQAKEELSKVRWEVLRIECNRFTVTYTKRGVPQDINVIRTKCRFKLDPVDAVGLLERKCWLQKEKANCAEVIACLDYLIEKYLTDSDAPKYRCRFILHGDGEVVEIISSRIITTFSQYVLVSKRNSGVSMYPEHFISDDV